MAGISLIIGVEKFYIYDNESEDNLEQILEPHKKSRIVEYKYCRGKKKQIWAYNDILETARKETYWLAVIDCDEFIVPISTKTIPELLKDFEWYGGLGINWLIYGSSGQQNKREGLVIERFKDHSVKNFEKNVHIKTIVNTRYTSKINVHDARYVKGKFCVNTNYEKVEGPFNNNIVFDKARINHYFTKSYEEYLQKRQRGIACDVQIRPMNNFYDHDKNEERNDVIMDKYCALVKQKIEERYRAKTSFV